MSSFPKLLCTALILSAPVVHATDLFVGTLSYDTFIPAGGGSPGVDAFNIANFTGAFDLPPDFPVSDDLTFESAVLTLTLADLSQQVFDLGDIAPGFLIDGSGNPVVQVPGNANFTLVEFTATLAPTTFTLFDDTSFNADSAAIDISLTPTSGPTLTVDVDQTTIDVSGSQVISTPEPRSSLLMVTGVLLLLSRSRFTKRLRP